MKVSPFKGQDFGGIPNYYSIYYKWYNHYKKTGEVQSRSMAFHYARVAEEMGQAWIEEDETDESVYFESKEKECLPCGHPVTDDYAHNDPNPGATHFCVSCKKESEE
jgi:hypothetical protein